ncbi:MAG: UDP-N-acetylmuramoyl-L-alanyl-D-glutamate--2,6-diaminopimelate ligase, partial [Muribaculaceae bacterium]|nr:UDP-N-acetylmuramoyl-L-alanyl-D-glutamate--2,6-diaminopimelate ligase [Muribaculaceae bacterium]
MKLQRLIDVLQPQEVIGETNRNITSVRSDSRKVERDGLFVAVRGVTTDGHKYIPVVASAHVAAIVCEELPASLERGITYIRVANS